MFQVIFSAHVQLNDKVNVYLDISFNHDNIESSPGPRFGLLGYYLILRYCSNNVFYRLHYSLVMQFSEVIKVSSAK